MEKKPLKKKPLKKKKPLIPKLKKPLIPKLDMDEVRSFAYDIVYGLIREKIPGEDKHALAVDKVAKFIDEKLDFGPGVVGSIAEALDGPIASLLVGAIVKESYNSIFHPKA
tara:strand:- start:10917 stop:11249 length:333 start_codon:yes stop_codon:yes gene_type:complete